MYYGVQMPLVCLSPTCCTFENAYYLHCTVVSNETSWSVYLFGKFQIFQYGVIGLCSYRNGGILFFNLFGLTQKCL